MHKKHSHMKEMLAKSFKREKEWEKKKAEDQEMFMYKLEDKHEKWDKVKTNKKALDTQFNIKMNNVSRKYNEKQQQVEKNRFEFTNQKRNLTVDNQGSNANLDYPMNRTATASQHKLTFDKGSRMLSATTRALDRIQLDEEIQLRLGKVKEKMQRAEMQKIEELHKKVG